MTKRFRLAGVLLVAPLAFPTAAAAAPRSRPASAPRSVSGTVVHATKRTGGFVVADHLGRLLAVHSARAVLPGSRVTVAAQRLSNGTYAAADLHSGTARRQARLRGRVTYIAPTRRALVVSARGVSLLVRLHPHTGASAQRALAASSTSGIGASVVVDAQLGSGPSVTARDLRVIARSRRPVDLEGVVQHVSDRTLEISADDDAASGASLTVHLPAGFDVSSFAAGEEVQLVARPEPDGSFTAVGASGDSSQQQADSSDEQQGDDGSCDPSADSSCVNDGSCDAAADPNCADDGCDVSVDPTCTDGADPGPGVLCDPSSDPTCLSSSDSTPSAGAGGAGGGDSGPGAGPHGSSPPPGPGPSRQDSPVSTPASGPAQTS